jgi:hypothetical protein
MKAQDVKESAAMEPSRRSAPNWEMIRELSFLAKESEVEIEETPAPEPIEGPRQPPVEGHEHMHFFLPVEFDEKGEPIPLDVPDVNRPDPDHDHGDHGRGDHDHEDHDHEDQGSPSP